MIRELDPCDTPKGFEEQLEIPGQNSLKSLIVVIPDINHISAVLKGLQNYFKIPG